MLKKTTIAIVAAALPIMSLTAFATNLTLDETVDSYMQLHTSGSTLNLTELTAADIQNLLDSTPIAADNITGNYITSNLSTGNIQVTFSSTNGTASQPYLAGPDASTASNRIYFTMSYTPTCVSNTAYTLTSSTPAEIPYQDTNGCDNGEFTFNVSLASGQTVAPVAGDYSDDITITLAQP